MNTHVTICPPSSANTLPPEPQFFRIPFPVEAKFIGYHNTKDGSGFEATGIAFDDYSRMHRQKRTSGVVRRLDVPDYMKDPLRFRTVIVRYLEIRCGLVKRQPGTLEERLARVQAAAERNVEYYTQRLDAFCQEFMTTQDQDRKKVLSKNITSFDVSIRIFREPWILPSICKAYYGERLNSRDVGERFGITQCNVRQILYRISQLDKKIQNGTDARGCSTWPSTRMIERAERKLGKLIESKDAALAYWVEKTEQHYASRLERYASRLRRYAGLLETARKALAEAQTNKNDVIAATAAKVEKYYAPRFEAAQKALTAAQGTAQL